MAELLLGWPLERPAPEIGFRPTPVPQHLLTVSPSVIADDAFMLSEMIACGSRGTKEPFWDDHAASFIAGLIAHVAMAEEPLN